MKKPLNIYELIEIKHVGQYRNKVDDNAISYTEHLYGVASVISSAMNLSGEIEDDELGRELRDDIIYAALGHDLIEDTDVSEDEIIAATNERTLSIIKDLTNPDDDSHTERYMNQLEKASEEARIVKYADLIENTLSVTYNYHILGKDWLEIFYRPILEKTTGVLGQTQFEKYPETARILKEMLATSTALLNDKSIRG